MMFSLKQLRKSKKGYLAEVAIVVFTLFILLSVLGTYSDTIKSLKKSPVGEKQFWLSKEVGAAEMTQLQVDLVAKHALRNSIQELAANGGFSEHSDCGSYGFFELYSNGTDPCYPDTLQGIKDIFLKRLEKGVLEIKPNKLHNYPNDGRPLKGFEISVKDDKGLTISGIAKKDWIYGELYYPKKLEFFPIDPLATGNIGFENDWHTQRSDYTRYHLGTDISAPIGTNVIAAVGGKVTNIGCNGYGGNRIGITASDGTYYYYAHLDSYDPSVDKPGTVIVSAGDVIGTVGNTRGCIPGCKGIKCGVVGATSPHLHFGIYAEPSSNEEFGSLTKAFNPYYALKESYAFMSQKSIYDLAGHPSFEYTIRPSFWVREDYSLQDYAPFVDIMMNIEAEVGPEPQDFADKLDDPLFHAEKTDPPTPLMGPPPAPILNLKPVLRPEYNPQNPVASDGTTGFDWIIMYDGQVISKSATGQLETDKWNEYCELPEEKIMGDFAQFMYKCQNSRTSNCICEYSPHSITNDLADEYAWYSDWTQESLPQGNTPTLIQKTDMQYHRDWTYFASSKKSGDLLKPFNLDLEISNLQHKWPNYLIFPAKILFKKVLSGSDILFAPLLYFRSVAASPSSSATELELGGGITSADKVYVYKAADDTIEFAKLEGNNYVALASPGVAGLSNLPVPANTQKCEPPKVLKVCVVNTHTSIIQPYRLDVDQGRTSVDFKPVVYRFAYQLAEPIPDPITDLSVQDKFHDAFSVTLKWTQSDFDAAVNYTLYYSRDDISNMKKPDLDTAADEMDKYLAGQINITPNPAVRRRVLQKSNSIPIDGNISIDYGYFNKITDDFVYIKTEADKTTHAIFNYTFDITPGFLFHFDKKYVYALELPYDNTLYNFAVIPENREGQYHPDAPFITTQNSADDLLQPQLSNLQCVVKDIVQPPLAPKRELNCSFDYPDPQVEYIELYQYDANDKELDSQYYSVWPGNRVIIPSLKTATTKVTAVTGRQQQLPGPAPITPPIDKIHIFKAPDDPADWELRKAADVVDVLSIPQSAWPSAPAWPHP